MDTSFKAIKKLVLCSRTNTEDMRWIQCQLQELNLESQKEEFSIKTQKSYSTQLVHPGMVSSNVPRILNAPLPLHEESCLNLIYEFEDGTQVDVFSILYHPYGKFVPRDLLPLKTAYNEYKIFAFERDRDERLMEIYAAMIQIIQKAFFIIRLRGDSISYKVFIYFSNQNLSQSVLLPVNSLDFYSSTSLDSQDEDSDDKKFSLSVSKDSENNLFTVKLEWGEEKTLIQKNLMFNFQKLQLSFHSFYPEFIQFLSFGRLHGGVTSFDKNQEEVSPEEKAAELKRQRRLSSLPHNWGEISLESAEEIESIYHEVPQLKLPFGHLHQKLPRYQIDYNHSFAEIHFNDNGDFRFFLIGLKEKESYVFSGFTTPYQTIFETLSETLKDYVRPLFSGLRIYKDKFIQKVLNHKGINIFFHYEILSFLYKNKEATLSLEDKEKLLYNTTYQMISIVSRSARETAVFDQDTKNRYARYLVQLLRGYFDHLVDTFHNDVIVFEKDEIFEFKECGRLLCSVILVYIESVIKLTSGDCLTRPSKNIFRNISDSDFFKINLLKEKDEKEKVEYFNFVENQMALRKQLAPWLMECPLKKVKYFLNGLPLRNIEELSLKGEFYIDFDNSSGTSSLGSNLPTRINWFELKPSFFINGKKVEIEDTEKLSQSGLVEVDGSVYYIRSQNQSKELHALNWLWNKSLKDKKSKNQQDKVLVSKNQTLELFYLRKIGFKVDGGDQWKKMCEIYDNLDKGVISISPSEQFQGELKPYQKSGLNWINFLYELRLGGVLADDMGLGKTVQALAFFDSLNKSKKLGHCLIVVPTSLTFNWLNENNKFCPHLKMRRFQTSVKEEVQKELNENPHMIIVTSYGLLHEQIQFFEENRWNVILFDEAQYLKNILAKRTMSARKINANFKLCLTGTPFENHFHELYSILDLALPGSLGSLKEFKKDFVNKSVVEDEKISFLKKKIKPIVLRRTKSEILSELPEKIESEVKIPFETGQREIYKKIAQSWNREINEQLTGVHKKQTQMLMLTALLRLRQVCSDPDGIPDVSYSKIPPKIEVLLDSVESIVESGESVLIYTQFLGTLSRIETLLKKKSIKTFILKGQLSQSQREKALEGFTQCTQGSVFLMTLKTGGVGLNLTKANYVFHIEPWWNPAIENQATDRTHRIGQQKTVNVYRYLMMDSVEEKIQSLKEIKKKRFDSLFQDKNLDSKTLDVQLSSQLTKEDFDFLIEA